MVQPCTLDARADRPLDKIGFARFGTRTGTNAMVATLRLSLLLATACSQACREGVAAPPVGNPGAADFFVSPRGKDMWSGKPADPGENDGPFATVARAREAVRALLKTQKEPRRVRVVLRGGTYYLDSPLEFGPEDSGTEKAPVVYAAAAGEKVVLSGGRRLEGGRWGEVNGRRAWVVDIPEVKEGRWRFRQLFVNGARRPRTRLPKQGEYRIESLPGYTGDFLRSPTKQFVYAPGNIVPTWRNLQDVEIVGITRWLDNRLPIESVNAQTRTVTFDRPSLFALLSGEQARALLGGERLRGAGHSRPMVSRSSTRGAVLSAATGRGDAVGRDHRTAAAAGGAGGRARGRPGPRPPF